MNFQWTGCGKRIESKVRKALYDFDLVGDGKISVALSGGKDSITLLYMLKAISGKGFIPFNLSAIFVDGPFTCGSGVDKNYLADICRKLEVDFVVKESTQKLETLECYGCSRERRSLIFEEAKKFGSTSAAFGHHQDDSVQTLLMNLLNKGEFAGNLPKVPMHNYGITIIRPLIFVTEAEIREFAKKEGFLRVMCQCPVGQNSMRKKVDTLLKDIETLYPDARDNIARAILTYGSDKALRV